ncbi:MAG: AraC family transcriptional regulator [Muribaculaceae bacterium]|nr:AraC family transcriptional regulator [Muribaculaceae bacterium]
MKDYIATLKFSKSECGVDFMINTADETEKRAWFDVNERYVTDFFEFFLFHKAQGYMLLDGLRINLHDNTLLIITPGQRQEWHVEIDKMKYNFLVFQENFMEPFIADRYLMFKLLFCYQHDLPQYFAITREEADTLLSIMSKMKSELRNPIADSYQFIVAYNYEFLLTLNRMFAVKFGLEQRIHVNNIAFQYKELLESHIREYNRVKDYAKLLGISRVALNAAVDMEFGVTAIHLLKQRQLKEIKDCLLFENRSPKEIASIFGFSAASHLMRFFKKQTGQTIGGFIKLMKENGHE